MPIISITNYSFYYGDINMKQKLECRYQILNDEIHSTFASVTPSLLHGIEHIEDQNNLFTPAKLKILRTTASTLHSSFPSPRSTLALGAPPMFVRKTSYTHQRRGYWSSLTSSQVHLRRKTVKQSRVQASRDRNEQKETI